MASANKIVSRHPASDGVKWCNACKVLKPANRETFGVNVRYSDGFDISCRECRNSYIRALRLNGPSGSKTPIVADGFKWCNRCKTSKLATLENFSFDRHRKDKWHFRCKMCTSLYSSQWGKAHRNRLKIARGEHPVIGKISYRKYTNAVDAKLGRHISHIRSRSLKNNIPFDLSSDHLPLLWAKQNGICALTGDAMNVDSRPMRFRASVDRIDPSKGYTKDNVQLVCWYANTCKQNLNPEALYEFCFKVLSKAGRLSWSEAA